MGKYIKVPKHHIKLHYKDIIDMLLQCGLSKKNIAIFLNMSASYVSVLTRK